MEENLLKAIADISERLDISAEKIDEETIEISFYSTKGQDFFVDISIENFMDELYDYICNFDPDEEAVKWIGPDGHGINGAPYRISDILADEQEILNTLTEFYQELIKEL